MFRFLFRCFHSFADTPIDDDKGISGTELLATLQPKGYTLEIPTPGTSLERLWHSDMIDREDAGIICVDTPGEGSHAVGVRNGKIYAHTPAFFVQRHASSEVTGVFFRAGHHRAAIERAVRKANPVEPVHEEQSVDVDKLVQEITAKVMNHLQVQSTPPLQVFRD